MANEPMSIRAAHAELSGMARVLKAFAKLDDVLTAAVTAENELAEKRDLIGAHTTTLEKAQLVVARQAEELATQKTLHAERLAAAQEAHVRELAELADAHQVKREELLQGRRALEEEIKRLATDRAKLEGQRQALAAQLEIERAAAQRDNDALMAAMHEQAYQLQTKINELKLTLRTTMDQASQLL